MSNRSMNGVLKTSLTCDTLLTLLLYTTLYGKVGLEVVWARHDAKGVGMFDCFCSAKIRSHPYQAEGVDASFLKAQQFLLFSYRYNNMGV
jgi:hypothetical protein